MLKPNNDLFQVQATGAVGKKKRRAEKSTGTQLTSQFIPGQNIYECGFRQILRIIPVSFRVIAYVVSLVVNQ